MAINVSGQYDGGFLPDIILLTQCNYHRGTRLNAIDGFLSSSQPTIPPKRLTLFPLTGGYLGGLDSFSFF